MPNTRKITRQKRVIIYLQNQLKTGFCGTESAQIPMSDNDRKRIEFELDRLLNPKAKKKAKTEDKGPVKNPERWYIDIYSIKYGYIKNSERKKQKGKSRKKMKKVKTSSLLKSVVAQDGMITAYKEGRMGLSPKNHSFKLRKEELFSL
jgi:hypothetical protein